MDDYDEALNVRRQARKQFHQPPYLGRVVAPNSEKSFEGPVFRGRIRVDPPLEHDDVLRKLGILEHCFRERMDMEKVSQQLGVPLEELIAKYGSQGEFLDWEELTANLDAKPHARESAIFPGFGVPPASQPSSKCSFHYWEEDSAGRVVRLVNTREESEFIVEESVSTVAYLAWNQMEKFRSPVEWLAYLTDAIFTPLGRVLNGSIEWWDYASEGTIRIENSVVSVPWCRHTDIGRCEGCTICGRSYEGEGPLDYVPPLVDPLVFLLPGTRDFHRVKAEQDMLATMKQPCTWQSAARSLTYGRRSFHPAVLNSVLLSLPAAPPVECSDLCEYRHG